MNSGYCIALGSIFQGGRWDHDADNSTPWVPAVFKTTDEGTTWNRKYLTTTEGTIYSLAVNPSDKKIIFAGGFIKNASSENVAVLYKTTNEGTNWNPVTVAISGWSYINAIVFSSSNANRVYLCTSQGVFTSTDGGTNWQPPSAWFNAVCLSVDPKTAEKAYVGSTNGVYITTNGGTSWTTLNTGLVNTNIQCMDLDPVNNTIYIGTQGGGVYRLSLTTGIEDGHPNRGNQVQFVLHQNYPNPFNASTEIRYDLSKAEKVRLSLFDVQGKIIRVLLDRIENEGEHKARWDGKDGAGRPVPSGIYFYRLQTESGSVIRKLALQK